MNGQIRSLERVDDGPLGRRYWKAEIVFGTERIQVDSRHGSWQALCGTRRLELAPEWAARLQDKVRPLEKREKDDDAATAVAAAR